ncbi:peroxisomal N(1)-acetyl-spermine/spermidine oxidase-like isoform X2 [Dinothrombium tinctorium]|uniref:Peroxisomal N(1)-acetyl-spermine/spermidine oxidase-like isoform X2 n=1 Tax=Dinothrombium tinctorium TaxID=1965070 RepID=A0A443QI32_9ACAR|nr:peroxisomal N(1)-acetyl-spermine/spermidine oxidase-like isoform X2 [Dinothrombium tinctorium]
MSSSHLSKERRSEVSPNVLLAFIAGNSVEYIEAVNDAELGILLTNRLREYTGDQTLPKPDRILKSTWLTDKFFRGAYSSLGLLSRFDDFTVLSEPLPSTSIHRLLFAGEATTPAGYGTMHGARESGIREENRLIWQMYNEVSSN